MVIGCDFNGASNILPFHFFCVDCLFNFYSSSEVKLRTRISYKRSNPRLTHSAVNDLTWVFPGFAEGRRRSGRRHWLPELDTVPPRQGTWEVAEGR